MNGQKLSKQVMWPILITLVLVGCGAPAAAPTPVPATATLPLVPEIKVTFDGNDCTVSGPTELSAGAHSFVLNDLSELNVYLWVGFLHDGKTIQDLIDGQSEPGEWYPKPSWFDYDYQKGSTEKKANGDQVFTYFLSKEGEHVIYVGVYPTPTKNLWFCAQIKVIEAPSE